MIEKDGVEDSFHLVVAEMLKCTDYKCEKFLFNRRTRWNNRAPGSGRFIGYGIIRCYSPTNIHVILRNPIVTGIFKNYLEALEAIKQQLLRDERDRLDKIIDAFGTSYIS